MGRYSRYKTSEIISQIFKELSSILFKQGVVLKLLLFCGDEQIGPLFQSFLDKAYYLNKIAM